MERKQPPYGAIEKLLGWAVLEKVNGNVTANHMNKLRRLLHVIVGPYREGLRAETRALKAERRALIAQRSGGHVREGDQAVTLIRSALAKGPQPVTALLALAKKQGISDKKLRRAAALLDVTKRQRAAKGRAFWTWELPASEV